MAVVAKKIENEKQAWDLLKEMASSTKQPEVELVFEDFPKVVLKFEGPQLHSSLAVRHMDALRAIQNDIYRLYALAAYDDESYTLSIAEKEELELFFRIQEGSSDAWVEGLGKALTAFAKKAADKMEPKHYITMALIAAVTYAAPEIYEKRITSQTAIETAKADVAKEKIRQDGENERLKIFAEAMRQVPKVEKVIESKRDVIEKIAKSVKGREKVVLPDKQVVTEEVAKELFPRSKKRTAVQERIDGSYTVKGVNDFNGELKAKICNIHGKEFLAEFSNLDSALTRALFEALSKHQPINLQVNAKNLEGEYKEIFIVGLGEQPTVIAEKPASP